MKGPPGALRGRDEEHGATRCVLCLGSRVALLARYRALAEQCGVRLIHCATPPDEAGLPWQELMRSADGVLCPLDCMSHPQCRRLVHDCQRRGKPCQVFESSGVLGFAAALARLTRDATDQRETAPGTGARAWPSRP